MTRETMRQGTLTGRTAVHGRPVTEREIVATAATQLRMLIFGALNWRSRPEEDLSG